MTWALVDGKPAEEFVSTASTATQSVLGMDPKVVG